MHLPDGLRLLPQGECDRAQRIAQADETRGAVRRGRGGGEPVGAEGRGVRRSRGVESRGDKETRGRGDGVRTWTRGRARSVGDKRDGSGWPG